MKVFPVNLLSVGWTFDRKQTFTVLRTLCHFLITIFWMQLLEVVLVVFLATIENHTQTTNRVVTNIIKKQYQKVWYGKKLHKVSAQRVCARCDNFWFLTKNFPNTYREKPLFLEISHCLRSHTYATDEMMSVQYEFIFNTTWLLVLSVKHLKPTRIKRLPEKTLSRTKREKKTSFQTHY